MLGLRLRVHDVLPGLAALKPRRIRQMTTDEGRELLCNIQGPIAARLIAISQARFAAGGSTNIISIFRRSSRPICRSLDSLQEMAGPPPSPCASHSEVSGRLGTRKFDQMRIKICFSPIKPLQILQRTCLVRFLVPNLCHIPPWPGTFQTQPAAKLENARPWIRPALENRVQNPYDCIGRYR